MRRGYRTDSGARLPQTQQDAGRRMWAWPNGTGSTVSAGKYCASGRLRRYCAGGRLACAAMRPAGPNWPSAPQAQQTARSNWPQRHRPTVCGPLTGPRSHRDISAPVPGQVAALDTLNKIFTELTVAGFRPDAVLFFEVWDIPIHEHVRRFVSADGGPTRPAALDPQPLPLAERPPVHGPYGVAVQRVEEAQRRGRPVPTAPG